MVNVYLLTNDGSGEDGDEWLLDSIHATKESAEAAKTEWYRSVEEWEIEGSLLTDAEREAVEWCRDNITAMAHPSSAFAHIHASSLRGLLARCATGDAMNTIDPAAYEGDLVSRLRNWRGLHLAHGGGDLFEEAANEIERLRESADRRGEIAVDRRREIARLRLTDEERDAVEAAARIIDAYEEEMDGFPSGAAATLRGLLARCATGSGEG